MSKSNMNSNFFSLNNLLDKMTTSCACVDAVYFESKEENDGYDSDSNSSILAVVDSMFDDVDSEFEEIRRKQQQYHKDQQFLLNQLYSTQTTTREGDDASRDKAEQSSKARKEGGKNNKNKNKSKNDVDSDQDQVLPPSPTNTYTTVSLSYEYEYNEYESENEKDDEVDEVEEVETTATTDITSKKFPQQERQVQRLDCFRKQQRQRQYSNGSSSNSGYDYDCDEDDPRKYRCLLRMKPQNYMLSSSSFDKEESDDSYLVEGGYRYLSPVLSPVSSAIDNGEYDYNMNDTRLMMKDHDDDRIISLSSSSSSTMIPQIRSAGKGS